MVDLFVSGDWEHEASLFQRIRIHPGAIPSVFMSEAKVEYKGKTLGVSNEHRSKHLQGFFSPRVFCKHSLAACRSTPPSV